MSGTRKGFIKRAGADGAVAAAGELSQANASPQRPDKGGRKPPKARQVRCVVTGRDKSGKSVIVSNDLAAPVTVALLPEVHFYRLWGSDSLPALPSDGTPTLQPGYFPSKNGFRFGMFTLPPAASKRAEPVTAAALEETRREPARAFGGYGEGSTRHAHDRHDRLRRRRVRRSGHGIGRRSRSSPQGWRLRYSERNSPRLAQPVIRHVSNRLLVAGRRAQMVKARSKIVIGVLHTIAPTENRCGPFTA